MKILRAYKTELDPNQAQRKALLQHVGAARKVWNWGLERKREAYNERRKAPNAVENHKAIVSLKHMDPDWTWLNELSKCAPQEALWDLDQAWRNHFRDPRRFESPTLKSRKRDGIGTFRLTGSIVIEERQIQLPRIGHVRLRERGYLPARARSYKKREPTQMGRPRLLSVTVSERTGRWFVSVQVEEVRPDPQAFNGEPCGVDVGSQNLATLDDGTVFNAPRSLEKNLRKLRRLQRSLTRKGPGSRNRKKAGEKVAKLHFRIANIRADAIHKVTTKLAKTKPVIGVENLDVRRMMESSNTPRNRHLADAGLGEFHRQLDYKSGWYGSTIKAQPSPYTTMKCSACHTVGPCLPLSERTFRCQSCGFGIGMLPNGAHGRDVNAARNLKPRRQFVGVQGHEVGLTVDGAEACQSREVAGSQEPVPDGEAGINGGQGQSLSMD